MPELRHAGIVVRDLDRSLAFWRDWLGFQVESTVLETGPFVERLMGLPGVAVDVWKLRGTGGGQIELLRFHAPEAVANGDRTLTTVGLTHVAVTVESLDALSLDPFVKDRIRLNAEGTARVVFCTDPDGTLVELVEPVKPAWLNTAVVDRSGQSQAPDYLAHTYDEARVPYTLYPKRLAAYLEREIAARITFSTERPTQLLDLGCGRGEYLAAFHDLGYEVQGVDRSPEAQLFTRFPVLVADVDTDRLPTAPGAPYDVVLSKSVIEHCRDPLAHLRLMHDQLKDGGVAVVLTPDWESQRWGPFYIDPTHVSPFTVPGLQTALELAGFRVVTTRVFTQLPVLWRRPWLAPLVRALAALRLPYRPYHATAWWPDGLNTLIRFSRERMVLGVGIR